MKRLLCFYLIIVLLISISAVAFADNRQTIVYIADSSDAQRYHRIPNCVSLSRSNIYEATLEHAISKGLKQCHICLPPLPDFSNEGYIEVVSPIDNIEPTGNARPHIVSKEPISIVFILVLSIVILYFLTKNKANVKATREQTNNGSQNNYSKEVICNQHHELSQDSFSTPSISKEATERRTSDGIIIEKMSDGTIIKKLPDGSSMFIFEPK